MLAETPLPHGSGANLAVVGTLSEASTMKVLCCHSQVDECTGVSPRRGKTRTQPWPNARNPISRGAELVQSRVARLRLEQLLDQASCLMVRLRLQALRAAPEDGLLFKPAPA